MISSGQAVTYAFNVLILMASFNELLPKHIRKSKFDKKVI